MKRNVTRKVRMGYYVEQICRVLQRLPVTQANEIECEALWFNIKDSHHDIVDKLNQTTAQQGPIKECGVERKEALELKRRKWWEELRSFESRNIANKGD